MAWYFASGENWGTETLLSPFLGCRRLEGLRGKLSGLAGVWTGLERGRDCPLSPPDTCCTPNP